MENKTRRHAVLVDAGYLLAQGAQELCGTKVARAGRGRVRLNAQGAVSDLARRASEKFGGELLRVYWYDASPRFERISPEHQELGLLASVKLRLGTMNSAGEQKGVDALICKDLEDLAKKGAVTDILLVGGDEDLRLAVAEAQSWGVRVRLLAVGAARDSVGLMLEMECDGVDSVSASGLSAMMSRTDEAKASEAPKDAPTVFAAGKKRADRPVKKAGQGVRQGSREGKRGPKPVKAAGTQKAAAGEGAPAGGSAVSVPKPAGRERGADRKQGRGNGGAAMARSGARKRQRDSEGRAPRALPEPEPKA